MEVFTDYERNTVCHPHRGLHRPRICGSQDLLRVVDHHRSRGKACRGETKPPGLKRQTKEPSCVVVLMTSHSEAREADPVGP